MVECNPDLISMDDAIGRVGSAIYGDEWIGSLTKREIWLIERYVEGSSTTNRCSIMPGLIRYDVAGRSWAEFPGDPALVAEVSGRAIGGTIAKNNWSALLTGWKAIASISTLQTSPAARLHGRWKRIFRRTKRAVRRRCFQTMTRAH